MLLLFDNAEDGNTERVWRNEYVKHNLLRNAKLKNTKVYSRYGKIIIKGTLHCYKGDGGTKVTIVDVTELDLRNLNKNSKQFFTDIINGWIKKYPSLKRTQNIAAKALI